MRKNNFLFYSEKGKIKEKKNMDEMEENLTGEETWEEGVDGFIKFVSQEDQVDEGTIEYLDLDMEVIQEAAEYQPVPIMNSKKKLKRIKEKSMSSLEKKISPSELKLRPKYRPIRPKPSQSPARTNKLQNLTPIVNFNPTPGFIVATPTVIKKEKTTQETIVPSPSKGIPLTKVTTNGASLDNLSSNDSQNGKVKSRNLPKNSVELFFESMAKTVLNLPTHVQAEIKMEICRVVTMAEIKYLSEHAKNDKKG